MANKLLSCSFFSLDIFYITFNILVRFWSRNTNLDIFGNCTSLAHWKITNTLLKMDFKLRNKLKSKCVQLFDTPCTMHRILSQNYNAYDTVQRIQWIGYCAKNIMHRIMCKENNAYNEKHRIFAIHTTGQWISQLDTIFVT